MTTYSYSPVGQRTSSINADNARISYTYDQETRLESIVNSFGERTTFSYDANSRMTLKALANGARTSQSYDAAGQVKQIFSLKSDNSVILGISYDYNAAGDRVNSLESSGDTVDWDYDTARQLIHERRVGTGAYNITHTYDPVGNRLVKNESGSRTTYAYDNANQLMTAVAPSGMTTFTFDMAGNQQLESTPAGVTTNIWNYENQMSGTILPSGQRVTMAYNAEFRRVRMEE